MNIEHMPELHWRLGYLFPIALKALRAGAAPRIQEPRLALIKPARVRH